MSDVDFQGKELCLIDAGIQSLRNISLGHHLYVLNLHNNRISQIERLDHLHTLKHLDLSSNRIQKIEGLGSLHSLRTLNLSCNSIKTVEGLQGLRCLVKLNLSYNNIGDVSGFVSVWGSSYKLSHVELQGNCLQEVFHLLQSVSGCVHLVALKLTNGTLTNPLCHQSDYREKLFRGLAQLQVVDGIGRDGQETDHPDILADIPGLDSYMEYLVSSDSALEDFGGKEIVTPKIDQVLERFRNHRFSVSEVSSLQAVEDINSEFTEDSTGLTTVAEQKSGENSARLAVLEDQIAQLMESQKNVNTLNAATYVSSGHKVKKVAPRRDMNQTDGSDTEGSSRTEKSQKSRSYKKKATTMPNFRRQAKSLREKTERTSSASTEGPDESEGQLKPSHSVRVSGPTQGLHLSTKNSVDGAADHAERTDAQNTYLSLMKELETERERRWKAEQAAMKLVDHVKDLQLRDRKNSTAQETSAEFSTKLKQVLTNEKEAKLRLQGQLDSALEDLKRVKVQLEVAQEAEQSQRAALQAMEQTAARIESERLKQQAHEGKKVQEAQMRASASSRETDILRNTVSSLKGQIQQLQELLAVREQEFRKELQCRYSLDSKELQDLIEKEIRKVEKVHLSHQHSLEEKIEALSKQYRDLEEEFRLALQIEANRFLELQKAFEQSSQENAANKQALLTAQRKEERSSSMLSELTALVKEQKGRITELSRFKQEQTVEYKDRINTLETHVEEARKRMLQLELLKQEKGKLLGEIQAKDSVIEGLRAERKLWGQELAQQGASLSQDRGRLEAQIETLTCELAMARKQLEKEVDTVKIKTKMLEDQTETIRKLKQVVLEREEEVKNCREEHLDNQRQLEDQLMEEKAANQELQESFDKLKSRKEDLKLQVTDLQTELEESKAAHNILSKRWKDKSELIGQLEDQVHQMKDTWETKEKKLIKERDEALDRARVSVEKLQSIDDAFRQQLDSKEEQHQVDLQQLSQLKQSEIESAHQRVKEVEDEMRLLLEETEVNKRRFEEKVKKLTQAFADIQSGIV